MSKKNIYTDLRDIPVRKFIDVYCGDLTKLVKKGLFNSAEVKPVAERLVMEYCEIVGGNNTIHAISKKYDASRYGMILNLLEDCEYLIKTDNFKAVCDILSALGYKLNPSDKEQVRNKINSLKAEIKFKIARIKPDEDKEVMPERSAFYNEMDMVMAHLKFHFDDNKVSAYTYANWVRMVSEDIKNMQRSMKKK